MSDDVLNTTTRRRFLTAATTVVGAAGAVGIAVPFVGSWCPSAKAKAAGAPVKFDISRLEPGEMKIVAWRGKPVYVVHRTQTQIHELAGFANQLKDPNSTNTRQQPPYVDKILRSIKPEIVVLLGVCTHLGCAPKQRLDQQSAEESGLPGHGGFFCPCHGSRFDLAGRVYKDVPAPANLVVPPYHYVTDTLIVIGVDQETA